MNTSVAKVLSGSTTDTTATYSVKNCSNLTVMVKHTQTFTTGTQEGTLTIYGTTDDGTTKYLLGVKPFITGTVDGNGAISYGTAEVGTYGYEVVGSHKTLYFNWDDTKVGTGDATISVWVIGKEY
jgi:hypothetical protein